MAGLVLALLAGGGVVFAVSQPGGSNTTAGSTSLSPAAGTSSLSTEAAPSTGTPTTGVNTSAAPTTPAVTTSAAPAPPADVPSVPNRNTPIPTDASPPDPPSSPAVVSYLDSSSTPSSVAELVEWHPAGLGLRDQQAIAGIESFVLAVNAQDFDKAWQLSTAGLSGPAPNADWDRGYTTTVFYQLAFGRPRRLASDLFAVPLRFVSRQDPVVQNAGSDVTDCTLWPQYVYLVVYRHKHWLSDNSGRETSRPEAAPIERQGTDGHYYPSPVAQRTAC